MISAAKDQSRVFLDELDGGERVLVEAEGLMDFQVTETPGTLPAMLPQMLPTGKVLDLPLTLGNVVSAVVEMWTPQRR